MSISSRPTTTIDKIDRTVVNDALTSALSFIGWNAKSEEDYDWLNDLTHEVTDHIEQGRTRPRR